MEHIGKIPPELSGKPPAMSAPIICKPQIKMAYKLCIVIFPSQLFSLFYPRGFAAS
jgi:hypothetical protein